MVHDKPEYFFVNLLELAFIIRSQVEAHFKTFYLAVKGYLMSFYFPCL